MEISIRPHDLAAAAARLAGCARDLDAAVDDLQRRAPADVVDLGLKAIAASERGLLLTERAVRTLAEDLDRLADGLRTVAAAYPTVDASAVPRP
jgi:uncharacterized protein YukE